MAAVELELGVGVYVTWMWVGLGLVFLGASMRAYESWDEARKAVKT